MSPPRSTPGDVNPPPTSLSAQREAAEAYVSYALTSKALPAFLRDAQAQLDVLLGQPLRPPRTGGGYQWPATANERVWEWWVHLVGPWARAALCYVRCPHARGHTHLICVISPGKIVR